VAGRAGGFAPLALEREGGSTVSELIAVGAKAPDFELMASDGKSYRLSEVLKRSHALLVFYPGDFTPG
jgi:peroxiredoxin